MSIKGAERARRGGREREREKERERHREKERGQRAKKWKKEGKDKDPSKTDKSDCPKWGIHDITDYDGHEICCKFAKGKRGS